MFTGIVEEVGRLLSAGEREGGFALTVSSRVALQGVKLGDSVAVNGACLTVTAFDEESLTFGLAPETLSRTNLGELAPGDPLNLERAMPATGRFDGHIVQGHVDGTGTLASVTPDGDSLRFAITAPPELLRYVVPKGFIAVDGTSLTVIDTDAGGFTFMLVAYTQAHIAMPQRPVGSRVNLEVDILAKYVERLLAAR